MKPAVKNSVNFAAPPCGTDRGNDLPVLNELVHALDELLSHGKQTVIDVNSLPFGPHDGERLLTALGRGEVDATIRTLGESRVTETAYPGIWWVEHRNEQGAVVARFIEVAYIPEILRAQREDIAHGLKRLGSVLDNTDTKRD